MMSAGLLLAVLVFLLLSGFFSGVETGAYRVHPVRLQLRHGRGDGVARRLRRLLEDRQGLLATTLIGNNLSNYGVTVSTAMLLSGWDPTLADHTIELYTTLILTPVIFVFGEVVPKNWFREEADRLMSACSLPLAAFHRLMHWTGAVPLLMWLTRCMLRWWHRGVDWNPPVHPRQEMISLLREGVAEGALTREQSRLIDGVLSIANIHLGSVMIPSSKVVTLPPDAGRREVLEIMSRHAFTRYPVVQPEGRRVVGMVNIYDFLADASARTVADMMLPTFSMEPRLPVPQALQQLRQARRSIAVVQDRWGNFIGIITAKDLVEEVVGDLRAW